MKKYWPVILLGVGLLVVIVAVVVVRGRNKNDIPVEEEEIVAEIPFEKRPYTSLFPTDDGHYLKLKVDNIQIEAETLDYELLYKTSNGITQGVPGTVRLSGKSMIEAELLLGSESSGKFRYDEGVNEGTLSLKFRNDKGKLVGKLITDFRLYNETDELASADGEFKFELTDYDEQYFIVMETFGLPEAYEGEVLAGPIGVFGSDNEAMGNPDFGGAGNVMTFDNGWEVVEGESATGVFIVVN